MSMNSILGNRAEIPRLRLAVLFLLPVACCLLTGRIAQAATYYIDFASGADSNNGTAKATPWKRAPGMQGISGAAAAKTPNAGDRFIFKGGVTWDHTCFQMNIAWSGASGNPIYFGVDSTWFSGASWTRPIFSGDHMRLASGDNLVYVNTQDYITLDHLEIKGHMAFSSWGTGSINHYCATYLLMQNLFIHDWKLSSNISTDDAHGGVIGSYPYCRPTGTKLSYSTISNTEARDAGRQNGIAVRSTDIEFSVIHDVQTAQLFGLVHDSEFYNVGYPATGRGVVGSNQGFDEAYHDNVTYVEGWDGAGLPEVRPGMIYNNIFRDIQAGSGAIYLVHCPATPFYVFNNLVYNNYGNPAVQIDQDGGSGTCGDYHIWNNTFHVPSSLSIGLLRQVNRGITINTLDTRNNHYIFNGSGPAMVLETGARTWTNNNNVSQSNAAANAQGFVLANKYAPVSGTGATVNSGANLSSLGIFTTDSLGISRPQGTAWDIGAYEFGGTAPGNRCDLNNDGQPNAIDLQNLANAVLSNQMAPTFDLTGDSLVNALDVQLLANVVLGVRTCP